MTNNIDKLAKLKEREAAKVLRTVASVAFQNRVTAYKSVKEAGPTKAALQFDLEGITRDFLPNERWISGLKRYLATDDVADLMPDTLGPRIKLRFDSDGNKVGVDLELDPQTELVDIEAIWDLANNVLRTIKDTPTKTQPYHNLKRDSLIYNLRQSTDKTNREIAEFVSEQGYQGVTPEYISTILKRYEERLDIITPQ